MVSLGGAKRSWLHVAALGLAGLVLCAAGPGQQIPQNQRKGADGAHQSEHQDGRAAPATVHTPKQADKGQGKGGKAEEGQPSKALAEANMWATIAQAFFSFFGLLGLGFTIFIAHRAWEEAQRSADAAHKAIETTDKIGKAQVRAYLTVTKAWLTIVDRYPFVRIEISNSGQSPARNVWWAYSIRYQGQDTIARGSPEPELLRLTSGVSIPAGGAVSPQRRLLQFPLSEREAKDFAMLDRAFLAQVIVRVEFEDVFGDWWIEGASFHLLGTGVSGVESAMRSVLEEHESENG